MMKRLSILAFVLLCTVAVSAQHKRRVLLEEFTNASCGPCAAQNPTFNATVSANMQFLTPIKYQTSWPGVDPMNAQTQTDVAPRVTFYNVSGVPHLQQNGTADIFPLTGYNAAQIQAAYNTLTPVTMNMTHSLNATYDSVKINVSVTSDAAITGTLKLRVAVLEDEIVFATAPGTNGEKEFYQIMRKTLPNSAGTTTGNFTAGQTKTYSFAWKLANIYNLNQLSVAAFLQNDGTKEVYQSVRSEPIVAPDSGIKITADNVLVCAPGYSPSFTLTNTGNEALTSAVIKYRQGTGAWSFINWTGNLLSGESESVQIPSIVINTSGTISLEIKAVSSNLGVHPYLIEAGSIVKYTASLESVQALPLAEAFEDATFPPTGWLASNIGTNGWKQATNAGAGSTKSARCNFFDMAKGQEPIFNSPRLDLSAATEVTRLKFDHAYAYKNILSYDSLRIQITADCGETWETIFKDGKIGLSTAPIHGGVVGWIPEASEWRANDLDISAYNGQSEVLIRFVGKSGNGNNLFIDNVNISSTVGNKELTLTEFNLMPNPTRDFAELRFGIETAQKIQLVVYSAEGVLVQSQQLGEIASGEHRLVLNAADLAAGSYRVVLQGSAGVAQTQWVVVK
ncbi:MAG: Omp28-related outer membrane protein [Saprospiraceae bacterium]